eukprot:2050774-Rhodomonas_salina.2
MSTDIIDMAPAQRYWLVGSKATALAPSLLSLLRMINWCERAGAPAGSAVAVTAGAASLTTSNTNTPRSRPSAAMVPSWFHATLQVSQPWLSVAVVSMAATIFFSTMSMMRTSPTPLLPYISKAGSSG